MKALLLSLSPRAIHPTAQYNIPEDLNPQTHRCEKLNSRIFNVIWGPSGADHEEKALWNVESCNLIDALRRFRGPCCLHQPGRILWLWRWMILMIEPTGFSKESVYMYQTARCHPKRQLSAPRHLFICHVEFQTISSCMQFITQLIYPVRALAQEFLLFPAVQQPR